MEKELIAMKDLESKTEHVPAPPPKEQSHNQPTTLITFSSPHDPLNPQTWPLPKKHLAILLALLASLLSSTNGTILSAADSAISTSFQTTNPYWATTSWGIGGALFPLLLFPIMEDFGVRPVVLGTYAIFICVLIPVGFAQNFGTLVALRFFSGGCVQLLGNAVAGVIGDVFESDRERSVPINLYVTVHLVATSLGPVIGASILQFLSWRWIGHIEAIWTAAFFPLFVICLPETRGSVILSSKAKRMRKEGKEAYTTEEKHRKQLLKVLAKSVQRPLYMLTTESVVFVSTLWSSFSLGTIYLFTQSVSQIYSSLYAFTPLQASYIQSAIVIGELLGCILCIYSDTWYHASASRNTEVPGTPIPEARLYASIIGGFFGVTAGMLVFAWTSFPSIHWVFPTLGLAMVGFGTTAVVVSIANYLIDAYSKYAASALGAVGLIENTAIAFLPLASGAMYTNLGFQWASSVLGFVSLVLVLMPCLVLRWGREIRGRSPFMKEAILERQFGRG